MEDLDRVTSNRVFADRQLSDLAELGVVSDVPVVFQSTRFDIYRRYVQLLTERGQTYQCFCSRKEVLSAATAPHGGSHRYPGICRDLSNDERKRRALVRRAAIRLRVDRAGTGDPRIDDIVLIRNDGVPAYNLAVVVDDALQGITQVVRGEDLAEITPSQIYLQKLLNFRTPDYVHLPLVVGPDGQRLAKRHGDVTLGDCIDLGFTSDEVRAALLRSLEVGSHGWGPSSSLAEWLRSLL